MVETPAMAIYFGISVPQQFCFGATIFDGEGIKIDRVLATLQGTEINGFAANAAAQHLLINLESQLKPRGSLRIHTQARRLARRYNRRFLRALEEGGHILVTLLGEQRTVVKSSNSIEKSTRFDFRLADTGIGQ